MALLLFVGRCRGTERFANGETLTMRSGFRSGAAGRARRESATLWRRFHSPGGRILPKPMDKRNDPVSRRRTFAIISHPDAGKTTLTEKFLLYGGAIQLAGQVRAKGEARRTRSERARPGWRVRQQVPIRRDEGAQAACAGILQRRPT